MKKLPESFRTQYSSNNLEVQFTPLDGKKNLLIDPKLTKLIKDDAAIVYKLLQKLVIFKVDQFRTILTKSWKLA